MQAACDNEIKITPDLGTVKYNTQLCHYCHFLHRNKQTKNSLIRDNECLKFT